MRRRVLVLVALAVLTLAGAAGCPNCPPGAEWDPQWKRCQVCDDLGMCRPLDFAELPDAGGGGD